MIILDPDPHRIAYLVIYCPASTLSMWTACTLVEALTIKVRVSVFFFPACPIRINRPFIINSHSAYILIHSTLKRTTVTIG